MCAQFLIKSRVSELAKKFGIELPPDFDPDQRQAAAKSKAAASADDSIDQRVLPYRSAPVVVSDHGHRVLKNMSFSLVPSWSKEPKVKFATHNARLETVAEKPTWKKPFLEQRCLIPITHFIEPIYINKLAGNMVQFYSKSERVLAAAGIYDIWTNKQTGEVLESFSILTDEPPKFVAGVGHDRCPVFLKESAFDAWLSEEKKDPKSLLALLNKNRDELDLDVKIDRPLAKGWEKRVPKE